MKTSTKLKYVIMELEHRNKNLLMRNLKLKTQTKYVKYLTKQKKWRFVSNKVMNGYTLRGKRSSINNILEVMDNDNHNIHQNIVQFYQ